MTNTSLSSFVFVPQMERYVCYLRLGVNMKEQWFIQNKKGNFKVIANQCQISEIMAKLIVNRGISSKQELENYLNINIESMHKPEALKDMEKTGRILQEKIKEGKSIRVIGDYDVDGVMSTYILVSGLKNCGANVDYEIPDRKKDGYGINIDIIKQAKQDNIDTIITCDNGIAALSEMEYGVALGMTMLVTDHHNIVYEEVEGERQYYLPKAHAVVNPKQLDCTYPYKEICGAVVAYKVVQYLYQLYHKNPKQIEEFLEFAAIATVCDVMDLMDENRILVKLGLEKLMCTNNIGMQALLEEIGLKGKEISVYHLGFMIGPCINASGRLESAKAGLRMLLSDTQEEAKLLAKQLKELNDERKDMTNKGEKAAKEMIQQEGFEQDSVLVVYLPDCHESLAGIIAGRIKETYHKPTLILTKSEQGAKGSGRSIESYSMFDKLTECKDLLDKFGGHKMAAGFSLQVEKISEFRERLNKQAGLTEEDFIRKITFDDVLPFSKITIPLIKEFAMLEPYGVGNPKPLFALKNVAVKKAYILGANRNVLKLCLQQGDRIQEGILFRHIEKFQQFIQTEYGDTTWEALIEGGASDVLIDIIFELNINCYNNRESIQIVLQHYRK